MAGVFRDGQYFLLDLYAPHKKGGQRTLLNVKEIKQQLMAIVNQTKGKLR